jgi:predicted O-methyltransferase YrrM
MPSVSRWQDIPSYEDPGEQIAALYEMMVQLAPAGSTLVEVGNYFGRSLVCLAIAAKYADKGLRICGIDWCVDMSAGLASERVKNIRAFGVEDIVTLVTAPSLEAAKNVSDGSAWFIFIDADHTREAVAADIGAWMPKVQDGGIIAGHDYRWHLVCESVNAHLDDVLWEPEWPDIWLAPKQPVLDGDINLPTTIPKRASDPTIRQYFERNKI